RLRAGELPRRLEQLRPAAEPAAQSPAHGRRRDRRDRGRPRRGAGEPAMKPLRFAWVGFHAEGGPAFEALMQAGAPIHGVITLTPERRARRSGAIDYGPLCARYGVPLHEVADINGPDGLAALGALPPDVPFVIGCGPIVRAAPPAAPAARRRAAGPAPAGERAPRAAAATPRRRPDRLVSPEPRGLRLHSRAHASLPGGIQLARRHALDRVAGRASVERQRHH